MKIEELIEEYQKMGIELFLDKENLKFKAPKGVMTSEIKEVLKKNKQQIIEYLLREKEIKPDAEHKYNPFPLTDVQAAYMLGNSSVYEFGGFSCHTYFEVKTDFTDISILEKAWNKVIEKHDMLRAVIYEEGYQVIQKEVPWQKVLLNSIVTKPIEKQDQCIAEVRSRLAQKKYDVGEWPLCELEATFFDDGMCILHFSIDMMISDFISTNIILKDLVFYYNHPDAESVPFSISYRDIVLYQNQMQDSEKYLIDKEYWMKRIEHLPVELDLPMCISSDKKQQIKFIQFNTRVAAEKWIAVKNELYKARITPSSFILTVYASVLGKWIRNKNFCINVTLLNRPDYDENIQNIVGDFTTTNILQVDLKNKTENFKEKILTIQEQLWRDIEHSMFSGVQVIREMTRQTKSHVIVPIVFTSMLGMENSISKIANTSVEYKISQTPQVWIDCQVSEINEELLINWDVRNDIFPEGMINDIFNAFENVLMLFCKNYEFMDKTLIVPLPDETKKVRVKVNKTKKEFVAKTLHSGYVNTLKSRPNHIAFIYDHKKYTYHDLEKYISAIQSKLIACGCEKKDYVAVILPKGIWQVAATIGTLAFSTKEAEAYGIECAETAKCLMKNIDRNLFEEWVAAADKKSLLDIVYALQSRGIFVNKSSLWDFKQIRDKLGVLPKYDFLLTRWLEALCKEEYLVSIGNQVFQANVELISNAEINESWNRLQNIENKLHYSQMLIEYFKNSGEHLLDFLSGNKDPLSILFPEGKTQTALAAYRNNIVNTNINQVIIKYVNSIARQLNAQGKQLHILEVGAGVGGTSRDLIPSLKNKNVEYWFTDISTFFLNSAKETFADYKNVTYRLFDINQDYREQDIPAVYFDVLLCANVLHNAHNGMEVMKQLKEVMRENASFIIIEETVESYAIMTSMEFEYSINDITDYRKEINHIFFNREQWRKLLDQVNARIVCELPGIDDKLSLAGQCLFIASVWKGRKDIEKGKLLNYLEQELPVYEIPQYIEIVSKIDLSTNGKVDRKKLKIHMEESEKDTNEDSKILPSTEQEKILVEIWKEVLNRENISITDNFYELGGDSLLVAQTISQVKKRLPLAKEYQWNELMRKMLENPTIEGFAKVFEDVKYVKESEDNELVRLNFVRNGNDNKIIVLYPDGINSLSQYNGLINKIQEEFGSYTIIGVNLCENQVFFETAPECLIPDIGKVIAQKLMQAYSKCEIVLIGYCIGGLMAIETGRFLLEQGKNVNGIVTIDTRTCSRCIDNDLIMERIFKIILNGGEQDKLMDQQISDAVRAVLTDKKSAITNEELCNCGEQFSEVNKYFTELCTLSPKQRFDSLLDYQKIELDEERNRILNLYRMFRHNYRGVMNYAQDFYIGDVLALQCNDNTGFFLPAEMIFDSDFLQQTVLGNLSYEAIPGNHLTCLDNNNIPLIYGYIRKYLS